MNLFKTWVDKLVLWLKRYAKVTPMPPTPKNPDALLMWNNAQNCRHNVRAICDLEGLNEQQKNDLSGTIHCESNYNPNCVHPNVVNGITTSTDYGICQINDYFHIGIGKDFPSVEYVLQNPEACVRWMCKQWLAGNGRLWVCYLKNIYTHYTP